MISHGQYVEYSLEFKKLYIENKDEDNKNDLYYKKVFFGINFLTIGSVEYETQISNSFFNDWIGKNICSIHPIDKYPDFHYFYCNSKFDLEKKFNINSFPRLCMDYINYTFCLDNNDLFIQDPKDKNILYFMIIFKKWDPVDDFPKYFHFGLQFLAKYQLSFDPVTKIIYYFGKKEDIKEKEENNSSKLYIKISIIIVLAIILIILGMILQKNLTKTPRKIRANELDDQDFLYEQKE